jgi:hypothetical protein
VQEGFLPDWIGAGAALAALSAVSYIQFRHTALALVVVLVPLPGAALATWLQAPGLAPAYLCGFFIANVLAARITMKICDGEQISQAIKDAGRGAFSLLLWPGVLCVCIAAAFAALSRDAGGLLTAACVALSCISVLVLPLGARLLAYGGEFVTRANRAWEMRDRRLDGLAFIVQPRWGWAVSGIGLIFAVLGFFGAPQDVRSTPFDVWVLAAMGALFAATAYLATRDLRRAIAFCITMAILFCLARWTDHRLALADRDPWLLLALAALPTLTMAASSAAFARDGDNAAVAMLRSLERLAANIVFFCFGAAASMFVLGPIAGAVLALCGSVAALLVFPALTAAIFDLLPPRISLDAYRVR